MSQKSPLSHRIAARLPFFEKNSHEAFQLTSEQIATTVEALQNTPYEFIKIRPNKDGPGVEYAEDVIGAFHSPSANQSWFDGFFGNKEQARTFSYEFQYFDNKLQLIFGLPDEESYNKSRSVITGQYPNVDIQRYDYEYVPFTSEKKIAAGRLVLDDNIYHPLKATSGIGTFEREESPLRMVTSEISSKDETDAIVQVVFTPAGSDWRTRHFGKPDASKIGRSRREGNVKRSFFKPEIEEPTEKDKRTAKAVGEGKDAEAFYVTIRYFVFANTEKKATHHADSIANAYYNTYSNPEVSQRLVNKPYSTQSKTFNGLLDSINRRHTEGNQPLTIPELSALAHIPCADIDTPKMDWTYKAIGSQLPSDAPRRVESIDPKPFDEFKTTENSAADHLKGHIPALPPGNQPPASDDLSSDGEAENLPATTEQANRYKNPKSASINHPHRTGTGAAANGDFATDEDGDGNGLTTKTLERAPAESLSKSSRQKEFLTRVEKFRRGELTEKDIYENYNENVAENMINLIENQIEWKETQSTSSSITEQNEDPFLPEPYDEDEYTAIEPIGATREWMYDRITNEDRAYETKVHTEDGNAYMGRDVRNELIDIHRDHEDAPVWLGYVKDNRYGLSPVGIGPEAWFKHMILFGMTGTGKSTEQKNILLQYIQKGFGVCFIDPKGDAVKEFVQEIPEWREDDIIYIEPGSKEFDRVVGLNFLETSHDPGDPAYDREVTSIVNDLTAILKGGEYWGPKMEGITTNIARAMIRSELNFTLLDMYYVLLEEESRIAFANRVADEGFSNIHQYTKRIAEMDYEEVDAVVRRIQSWVEDPISRGIVAHREGTVNLTEATNDQKIILVDVSVDSSDIKEVVTTAIMRRIWAAIKARDEDEDDRPPFITLIDEFDDVATAEMNIEKMLSKARAGKMGVALACQNPSQIKSDSVREQMFGNARTMNTFGLGDPPDAELVAKRLGNLDADDVLGLPDYNVLTRILMQTDEGPQVSDPLPIKTFADYPPVRSQREATEVIEDSLTEYGVDPLDEPLEEATMLIHDLGNSSRVRRAFLESVWEAHIQLEQEYVSLQAINRRFSVRTGQDLADYPQGIHISSDHCEYYVQDDDETNASVAVDPEGEAETTGINVDAETFDEDADEAASVEANPSTDGGTTPMDDKQGQEMYPAETDKSGDYIFEELSGVVKLTNDGREAILETDDGRNRPTDRHRRLLRHGFEWLSRIEFSTQIVAQESHRGAPDARADLPIEGDWQSLSEAHEKWEELAEQYTLATNLTDGKNLNVEAEATVSKPARVLENLRRAKEKGRHCLFLVPDGREDDINGKYSTFATRIDKVLSEPACVRNVTTFERDDRNVEELTTLYNKPEILSLTDDPSEQKFPLLRKGKQTVWNEMDNGLLQLLDGEGNDAAERGRIHPDELDNASANAFSAWCRFDKYEDEWVVYPDQSATERFDNREDLEEEWMPVREPFHPSTEFDSEVTVEDYTIGIIPAPKTIGSLPDAIPAEYTQDGELEPLVPPEEFNDLHHEFVAGFNPIEDTPEELQDKINPSSPIDTTIDRKLVSSNGEGTEDSTDSEFTPTENDNATMNDTDSPEKTETSERTDPLANRDLPDYNPNFSPRTDFGGKDPTSRVFWEKVWDSQDRKYAESVTLQNLKRGVKRGNAVKPREVDAAVEAGIESGQIIAIEDAGFILAPPNRRPELLIEDAKEILRRRAWERLWDATDYDYTDAVPSRLVYVKGHTLPEDELDVDKATHLDAAIQLASQHDALEIVDEDHIKLGSYGPAAKWMNIWEKLHSGDTPSQPFPQQLIVEAAKEVRGGTNEEWQKHIEVAVERNELLETDEGSYYVNDPREPENPPRFTEPTFEDLFGDEDEDDGDDDPEESGSSSPNDGSPPDAGGTESDVGSDTSPDEEGEPSDVANADTTDSRGEEEEATTMTNTSGEPSEVTATDTGASESDVVDEAESSDESTASADTDEGEPSADEDSNDVESTEEVEVVDETTAPSTEAASTDEGEGYSKEDLPESEQHREEDYEEIYGEEPDVDLDADDQPGDEDKSDYVKMLDKVDYVPTNEAPEGWLEAFDATISVYHEELDRPIVANQQWNELIEYATDTYTEAAEYDGAGDQSTYIADSPDWRIRLACTECNEDPDNAQPTDIVRLEYESCGDDCSDYTDEGSDVLDESEIPNPKCDDMIERRFCPECAAAASVAPFEDVDVPDDREEISREDLTTPSAHDLPPGRQSLIIAENATCYKCGEDGFKANFDPEAENEDDDDDSCYCETHEYEAPVTYLPETAREYFEGPNWDDTAANITGHDLIDNGHDPNELRHTETNVHGRGWSPDPGSDEADGIVNEKQLGWAPGYPTFKKPIVKRLLADGYSVQQLLATGMFEAHISRVSALLEDDDLPEDDDGDWSDNDYEALKELDETNIQPYLDDDDHDLERSDLLRPRWNGRPIFPYFIDGDKAEELIEIFDLNVSIEEVNRVLETSDGDDTTVPVYACARSQKSRPHPSDNMADRKYDKLRDYDHVYASEPIWGTETLQEDTPMVITEGVADAIAADNHDVPVLSPVTVQFKSQHHDSLIEICELYDISMVQVAQDSEPGAFSLIDTDDRKLSVEELEQKGDKRERILDSDDQVLAEQIEEFVSDDDAEDLVTPLGVALDIDGVPPGLNGAFSTEEALEEAGLMTVHIDLPQLTSAKVDLDNYLSSGIYTFHPLFQGLRVLQTVTDTEMEQSLINGLFESGHFGKAYLDGYDIHQRAAEPEVLPDPNVLRISPNTPSLESVLRAALEAYDEDNEWEEADRKELLDAVVPDVERTGTIDDLMGPLGQLGKPAVAHEPFDRGIDYPSLVVGPDAAHGRELAHSDSDAEEIGDGLYSITFTPLFEPPRICQPENHPQYDVYNYNRSLPSLDSTREDYDYSSGSAENKSDLYSLTLTQITGQSVGYRGKNPLRHTGTREDYWKVTGKNRAFDFKRWSAFNALLFLAVDAGVRSIDNPYGEFSDEEILRTWIQAKKRGDISQSDPIPNRALNAAAVEMGICDWEDIGPKEIEPKNGEAFTIPEALSDEHYNEAIEQFEDAFGHDPGRSYSISEDMVKVEDVSTDRSPKVFAEMCLTTDVGDEDKLKDEYEFPRVKVKLVWNVYKQWCQINNIEPMEEYQGVKGEIAKALDVNKSPAKWPGEDYRPMCYSETKLNDLGYWVKSQAD